MSFRVPIKEVHVVLIINTTCMETNRTCLHYRIGEIFNKGLVFRGGWIVVGGDEHVVSNPQCVLSGENG